MLTGFVPGGRSKVSTGVLRFPNSSEEHKNTCRNLAHRSITSFSCSTEKVELTKAEASCFISSALAVARSVGVYGEAATDDTYEAPQIGALFTVVMFTGDSGPNFNPAGSATCSDDGFAT